MSEVKMNAAEFDERLRASFPRREREIADLEQRAERLAKLVAEKEELVAQVETAWKNLQRERTRIDREIDALLPEKMKP